MAHQPVKAAEQLLAIAEPGYRLELVRGELRRMSPAGHWHGAREAWIIDPGKKTVTVYRDRDDIRALGEHDELTGGDVVPGFRVRVSELFPTLPPARS